MPRTLKALCKGRYHSKDGKDSLPFSSHTLFCMLREGHKGKHFYYGGYSN